MDSPHPPSYLRGGPQPADDIVDLNRNASMENLRELKRYSKMLQFESTCVRLWANGTQDQLMDEQAKVQNWISGVTDEINRLRRIQPAWIQHLQFCREPTASDVNGPSFQLAAANSIIQCRIYNSSEASTGSKEMVRGMRCEECTVPAGQGS